MKLYLKILYLLSFLIFISCSEERQKENKQGLDYKTAYSICQIKYLENPDTVFYSKIKPFYIAAVIKKDFFNSEIKVLYNFADTWQTIDIIKDLYGVVDIEFVSVDSNDYILIVHESYGNAFGMVEFKLHNLETKKEYSISFDGEVRNYDQLSPIDLELKKEKNLLKILEDKAAKSSLVYKKKLSDYDLNANINCDNKWRILNKGLINNLSEQSNTSFPIKFPEYNENLFQQDGICKAENSYYIVNSYFKSSVIGYDKKKKKYFVIWVPESRYDWINYLEFKSDSIILLGYQYLIDINKKVIKRIE
jgi:hypothetical protein